MKTKKQPIFKVAIIGVGQVAQTAHLPFYKSSAHAVEIVGICGRNLFKTKEVAEQFGIEQVFIDPAKMLIECKPNVVSVCTPNNLHFQHVMQCLESGCHVFCEKPPAINSNQASAMKTEAVKRNLVLAYNLHYRQLTEVELVQKKVREDFFGKIYHIKATFTRRRGVPGWGNFTNQEVQGGGALIDIGIHVLDLALHLLNYPSLKATLGSTYDFIGKGGGSGQFGAWEGGRFTVEDSCFAHLLLENGSSISLETAFALHMEKDRQFSLELFGSKGGAVFPPLKLFSENDSGFVDTVVNYTPERNTWEKNLHRFLDACKGAKTNVCSAKEGAMLQQVIEQIYLSAKNAK